MEGASVVAIGHGIDVTVDADSSVVAYSTNAEYQIGKTLKHADEERLKERPADPNDQTEKQAALDAGNEA